MSDEPLPVDAKPDDSAAVESLPWRLSVAEVRVLGSLIEKAISTPEYYPMSINALVNACNQRSNRDPFLNLPEDEVRQALHTLSNKGLASAAGLGARVAKYEHRLPEVFNLGRREEALICVLLLRGAQTPGELRGRSERLFAFEDVADVLSTLDRLMRRNPPLVKSLPRQPGTKEVRYVHLLSGHVTAGHALSPMVTAETRRTGDADEGHLAADSQDESHAKRLDQLEAELEKLRNDVEEIRHQLNRLSN